MNPPTDKEKENSILDKIKTLNAVVSNYTPADDQAAFGEYTKYIPIFNAEERDTIKKKIMELVKAL